MAKLILLLLAVLYTCGVHSDPLSMNDFVEAIVEEIKNEITEEDAEMEDVKRTAMNEEDSPKEKRYISEGCWKDQGSRALSIQEGKSKLLVGNYKHRASAIQDCYKVAKEKGFGVFAVQDGGQCFGGPGDFKKYGSSNKCNNGKGGWWANDVYMIPDTPYISEGCWKDDHHRTIPMQEGKQENSKLLDGDYRSRKHAIQKCYKVAKKEGFSVFAVQHGGQCLAGAGNFKKLGSSDGCHNGKGGGWANNVYRITDSQKPQPKEEKYISEGCWKDTGSRALPLQEGKSKYLVGNYKTRNYATKRCYEVAKEKGFSVFAVQDGGQCFAGPGDYKKYGSSNGCYNGKGGWWKNNVYRIPAAPAEPKKVVAVKVLWKVDGHCNEGDWNYPGESWCKRYATNKGMKMIKVTSSSIPHGCVVDAASRTDIKKIYYNPGSGPNCGSLFANSALGYLRCVCKQNVYA